MTTHDTSTKTIRENLLVKSEDDYGNDYKSHCLEIYKLYVEKADAISSRRQSANSFFLAVNTAVLGVIGYVSKSDGGTKLAIGIAGVLLCFFWYRLIRSYKQINSVKFNVIGVIEKELPLSPYDAEWEALGRGKDPKLYKPFTKTEMVVPWVFLICHVVVIVYTILKYCIFGFYRF